jgi:hypothetical protein
MLWRPSRAELIEPCLPSPAKAPPSGSGWIHEIKHDGFRILARRDDIVMFIQDDAQMRAVQFHARLKRLVDFSKIGRFSRAQWSHKWQLAWR